MNSLCCHVKFLESFAPDPELNLDTEVNSELQDILPAHRGRSQVATTYIKHFFCLIISLVRVCFTCNVRSDIRRASRTTLDTPESWWPSVNQSWANWVIFQPKDPEHVTNTTFPHNVSHSYTNYARGCLHFSLSRVSSLLWLLHKAL